VAKTKSQKTQEIRENLTKEGLRNLYQSARFLDLDTRCRLGLQIPCKIYVQDPSIQARKVGLEEIWVRWEPSLGDGPTSSRLAVVDYDGDTGVLRPPAQWKADDFVFLTSDGKPVSEGIESRSPQSLQVNAWATVQWVLEYYEDPAILGRPIPWGFEGNRLMIVPQAGFLNNAFYERRSKSLKLYYFGDPQNPRYACLSHDILTHETGHALLDGIRPYFLENSSWETAAFHEFIGDLTAILSAFRNNDFRGFLRENFSTDLKRADLLAGVAEEFGNYVENRPFLRTALNLMKYGEAVEKRNAHLSSQMLTGAVFDLLVRIADQYLTPERQAERDGPATAGDALWWSAQRIGRVTLQPLDLLPPVDVRFIDYARALLRNDEISDPEDRYGYRDLILQVFHDRELCPHKLEECKLKPAGCALHLPEPPRLKVFHDPAVAARSRTAAYHLIHDNREVFEISPAQDFVISDVYDSRKFGPAVERLPRQIVIEYVWKEDVKLEEERFGRLKGETVQLLCGGTVVFDELGNLLWWTSKPGRGSKGRRRKNSQGELEEDLARREGEKRRAELLDHVARIVADRRLTLTEGPEGGILTGHPAAVVAYRAGGALRLETAPHLCGVAEEEEEWTTSF
jgi:hypothetical protein